MFFVKRPAHVSPNLNCLTFPILNCLGWRPKDSFSRVFLLELLTLGSFPLPHTPPPFRTIEICDFETTEIWNYSTNHITFLNAVRVELESRIVWRSPLSGRWVGLGSERQHEEFVFRFLDPLERLLRRHPWFNLGWLECSGSLSLC